MVRCVKRVEKLSSVMFLGSEWCLCVVGMEMWGLNRLILRCLVFGGLI